MILALVVGATLFLVILSMAWDREKHYKRIAELEAENLQLKNITAMGMAQREGRE